jgi:hypothetical protein
MADRSFPLSVSGGIRYGWVSHDQILLSRAIDLPVRRDGLPAAGVRRAHARGLAGRLLAPGHLPDQTGAASFAHRDVGHRPVQERARAIRAASFSRTRAPLLRSMVFPAAGHAGGSGRGV